MPFATSALRELCLVFLLGYRSLIPGFFLGVWKVEGVRGKPPYSPRCACRQTAGEAKAPSACVFRPIVGSLTDQSAVAAWRHYAQKKAEIDEAFAVSHSTVQVQRLSNSKVGCKRDCLPKDYKLTLRLLWCSALFLPLLFFFF